MLSHLKRLWAQPFAPLAAAALLAVPIAGFLSEVGVGRAAEPAVTIPAPAVDSTAMGSGLETAILAGGCFWGVQAVYQHIDGVESAVSGYSGGTVENPVYEAVGTGMTGHAEAVEIKFDPKKVSYGKLLQVFFSVAHNPTQLNYQGPDHGTQYRSAIFFTNDEQKKVAEAYIGQLSAAKAFPEPIVTEVSAAKTFYPAEGYHQDYATLHPDSMYIVINDAPKVENLKTLFPDIFRAEPMLVMGKSS
jgi:peptide-methionine (S)-S-oxide reductase